MTHSVMAITIVRTVNDRFGHSDSNGSNGTANDSYGDSDGSNGTVNDTAGYEDNNDSNGTTS